MTANEWIIANFSCDNDTFVVLDKPKTESSISWFINTFGAAFINNIFTHDGLSFLVANTGWQPIFNDWKNRGIIN